MPSVCEVRVDTLEYGVLRIPKPLPLDPTTRLHITHVRWVGRADFSLQMSYQTLTRTDSGGLLVIPGTVLYLRQPVSPGNTLILAQRHPVLRNGEFDTTPVGLDDLMLYQNREPNILTAPGPFNIRNLFEPTEVRGISFAGFSQALDGLNTGETIEQLKQARLGLNPEQLKQLLECFSDRVHVNQPAA